jgi:hypothetical protein
MTFVIDSAFDLPYRDEVASEAMQLPAISQSKCLIPCVTRITVIAPWSGNNSTSRREKGGE